MSNVEENKRQIFTSYVMRAANLVDRISKIKKGDWHSLVELAKSEGHELTKEDLMTEFGKLKGEAHPLITFFDWKKDHNAENPDQTLTASVSWSTYKNLPILQGQMQQDCYDIILDVANKHNIQISGGNLHNDKVNLTISYPIHVSFGVLIEAIKSETSIAMKQKYPELEAKLENMPLWSVD